MALRKATATENGAVKVDLVDMAEFEPVAEFATKASIRVPDISVYRAYQGRKFGERSEFEVFEYAMHNRKNILVEGPTGDGKTMAAMAFAASKGLPFYSIPCNVGIDPAALMGRYSFDNDGKPTWVYGGLPYIVKHGGVLLIDEVNGMPPKVSMLVHSLLDHRREITLLEHEGEVIKAHPDLLVIATMNPGYAGTTALNAAFRNRFPIQLVWDYDGDVEGRLVRCKTLREDIANGLRQQYREGRLFTPTSTNMMMEFEELGTSFGIEFAIQNFINHFDTDERAAVGLVFETYRTNLIGEFAELSDKGPDNPQGDHLVFADDSWIYVKPGDDSDE